jgi:alkylation response protein AidB-like acyl-CoA dehydrogenase
MSTPGPQDASGTGSAGWWRDTLTTALPEVGRALAGRAAAHDRDGSFPAEGIALVHEAGLLTATLGARHGGPGGGLAQTVTILRELGRGDPSVALITSMTLLAHALQDRQPSWPAGLYAAVAADALRRPVLINALRVEPDLGTPARGGLPATVARRTAEGWSLSGHKIFSTGAPGLDWMVVWARTADEPALVGGFLVPGGAPGVTIEPTWDHLGLRASRSDDVLFDQTPVAADAVTGLAEPGPPGPPPAVGMAWNNLAITAIYLGVAAAARDWLVGFLAERTPTSLGAPLASLPRFQAAVGDIESALIAAGELTDGLARRCRGRDGGGPHGRGQADRNQGRHRGGRPGRRAGRQQRADPALPAGAALPGRAVRPGPHAAGRHDPGRRGPGGAGRGRLSDGSVNGGPRLKRAPRGTFTVSEGNQRGKWHAVLCL